MTYDLNSGWFIHTVQDITSQYSISLNTSDGALKHAQDRTAGFFRHLWLMFHAQTERRMMKRSKSWSSGAGLQMVSSEHLLLEAFVPGAGVLSDWRGRNHGRLVVMGGKPGQTWGRLFHWQALLEFTGGGLSECGLADCTTLKQCSYFAPAGVAGSWSEVFYLKPGASEIWIMSASGLTLWLRFDSQGFFAVQWLMGKFPSPLLWSDISMDASSLSCLQFL